ncbi:hypothetical protein EV361DRAFT_968112 [Lentinula raphanica]|nr:hypothetical protein EV361DRAFT_968112 [Lentinula raphanica]
MTIIMISVPITQDQQTPHYPPPPLTQSKVNKVISQWNEAFSPDKFQEAGCVVCGQLTPHVSNLLSVLEADGVTQKQRSSTHDPIQEHTGPVLDHSAGSHGSVPKLALAHGLWLGDVPDKICFVRVQKSAGNKYCKLVSNVIAFENPTPHIYNVLPPPRKDMDDVLAVMFSGTSKPTDDDYKNALLLLRHHVIAPALEWLIVNHFDYTDYPENVPPVAVEFFKKGTNRNAEGVNDGVDGDQCVFTVHGVVGDSLKNMTTQQLKGIAAQHLDNEGKLLRVAHSSSPESLWNNTHLYPKMFPWLFPYGLGGLGAYNASRFSEKSHLKFLLNYHDKRFQLDESFPFVAFNQQQIKAGTSQAFLMADSNKFDAISDRFLSVDKKTLKDLSSRMAAGEHVKPANEEEQLCFNLLGDLSYASSKTQGSISSKKIMQSEIWSLVNHIGAPTWYITLSPCDHKHPISTPVTY